MENLNPNTAEKTTEGFLKKSHEPKNPPHKYFNRINFIFFALIGFGAFIIFGSMPGSDKTAEYTAEYKANLERIAEINKAKEEEIATQKAIYEAHKLKVAEYETKILELKNKNNALSVLIGEDRMRLIPNAEASSNWRTKEFSDWCYKNLGIGEINKASETTHQMCSVEGNNDFYKDEYLKILNGNGTPASSVPPNEQGASEVIREVSASVEQVEGLRMMDMFGLNGCRFTNEKHYIPRINADWYGYDYACIKGKAFSVGTPSDGWTIENIGFDKNLGNFVIIKKNNFRIVFGHLVTSRKVGEKLNKSDIVGQTNLSGAHSGMHIHIELWDGEENVSYEYLLGKPYKKKRADSLLKDRGFDFSLSSDYDPQKSLKENATALVKKYEGLHLKAYYDCFSNCEKETHPCSIGFGTVAKSCDEVITQDEAEERFQKIIDPVIARVQKDFPNLTERQQTALVSFAYNCDAGYVSVKENGLQMHHQWCKKAGGKTLNGLVKRRAEEAKLLFN